MQNETFSILIFHGSARSEAGSAAKAFEKRLREEPGCTNFSICFLKGSEPELEEALEAAISQGWRKISLHPLFLLPGAHTTHDIPTIAARVQSRHSEAKISINSCLVNDNGFLKLIGSQIGGMSV